MKKNYFLIWSFIVFTTTLSGQNSIIKVDNPTLENVQLTVKKNLKTIDKHAKQKFEAKRIWDKMSNQSFAKSTQGGDGYRLDRIHVKDQDNNVYDEWTFTYDESTNLNTATSQFYEEGGNIKNLQNIQYTYFSNGNLKSVITEFYRRWEDNNPYNKETYSYDEWGNLIETKIEMKQNSGDEYTGDWWEKNSYDSNGNQLHHEYYNFVGGAWEGTSKWYKKYNSNNEEIGYEEYSWGVNGVKMGWVGTYKSEWSKDSNGDYEEIKDYEWDETITDFVLKLTQNLTYEYNTDGKPTLKQAITSPRDGSKKSGWQFVYLYNANGLLDSIFRNDFDDSENWIDKARYIDITIDNIGWRGYTYERINNEGNWVKSTLYTSDVSNNRFDQKLYKTYDGSNWTNYSKTVYTYNDKKITENGYFWNADTGTWIERIRKITDFDNFGNQILNEYYQLTDGNLIGKSKYEETFNGPDRYQRTTHISYEWKDDTFIKEWENHIKYNNKGAEILYSDQWNREDNKWKEGWKKERGYDENGNLTFDSDYGCSDDIWFGYWLHKYTYDTYSNLTKKEEYGWEDDGNDDVDDTDWELDIRNIYTYDIGISKSEMILPIEFNQLINKRNKNTIKGGIHNGYNWELTKDYIYSSYSLSNNRLNIEELTFFPNPVKNILTVNTSNNVKINNIHLYDVSGKHILSSTKKQIDMSELSNGIYIIKIDSSKGSINKRIIKK